jgi:hypothetical protein
VSLEEIDLLFGERALGTLPANLEMKDAEGGTAADAEAKGPQVVQARVQERAAAKV